MRISDCDVIYDLLPSYIDGICTEATRRCVEDHLAGCPACEARAKRLRETALSGESLERIALDAAKKIKRRAVWQTTVRLALLLPFAAFASLGLNLVLRGRDVIFTGQYLPKHGFGLLAVCLLICAVSSRGRESGLQKADRWALVLSLAGMAASFGLMLYSYFTVLGKLWSNAPFSFFFGLIGPAHAGPTMRILYGGLFFLQAAVFFWGLARLRKRDVHTVPILQAAMTGMMLPMCYLMTLCSMNLDFGAGPAAILHVQLRDTGTALLIGAGGIAVGCLASKWRKRNKKDLPFGKDLL